MNLQNLKSNRIKIGQHIVRIETVDSTNDWLLSQTDLLLIDGLVVQAKQQLKGKGRQQKEWVSINSNNIYCSIVIHPEFSPEFYPAMTLFVGLAVFRALKHYMDEGLSVKWPNDLLVHGKKICGILCELKKISVDRFIIVAGIGINLEGRIDQFPAELRYKTTTLQHETGKRQQPETILNQVLNELDEILSMIRQRGPKSLFKDWENVSSSLGKRIEYGEKKIKVRGKIVGLSSKGYLKVQTDSGETEQIMAGEINFI